MNHAGAQQVPRSQTVSASATVSYPTNPSSTSSATASHTISVSLAGTEAPSSRKRPYPPVDVVANSVTSSSSSQVVSKRHAPETIGVVLAPNGSTSIRVLSGFSSEFSRIACLIGEDRQRRVNALTQFRLKPNVSGSPIYHMFYSNPPPEKTAETTLNVWATAISGTAIYGNVVFMAAYGRSMSEAELNAVFQHYAPGGTSEPKFNF